MATLQRGSLMFCLVLIAAACRAEAEKPPAPPPGFGDDTPAAPAPDKPKKDPSPPPPATQAKVDKAKPKAKKVLNDGGWKVGDEGIFVAHAELSKTADAKDGVINYNFTVSEIVDENSMVVKMEESQWSVAVNRQLVKTGDKETLFWVTGSTKGIVSGAPFAYDKRVFKVVGTKTHKTHLDSSTIFELKAQD